MAKLKLSKDEIAAIVADPEKAEKVGINHTDPWWVIVAKVLKYICELIIAGGVGFLAVSCCRAAGIY